MADLREYSARHNLLQAINYGDMPGIVKALREFPSSLHPHLVHKLANYLDPDRPSIPSGPKPNKTAARDLEIYDTYQELSENRGLAKAVLSIDIDVLEHEKPFKVTGSILPPPNYINNVGKNKTTPSKQDIKDYICLRCKISPRAFDDAMKRVKVGYAFNYYSTRLEHPGETPLSAKKSACDAYGIKEKDFDKLIASLKSTAIIF